MGVKEWEKILSQGSCYGVKCPECDDKMLSQGCRFKRKDGKIPLLTYVGLDDVARAKVEAALREAKGAETKASREPLRGIALAEEMLRRDGRCPAFSTPERKTSCSGCPVMVAGLPGCGSSDDPDDCAKRVALCKEYLAKAKETTPPAPSSDDIAFVRKVAEPGSCWPNKSSGEVCPRCQKIGGGEGFCQTSESRQTKAKAWLAKYAPSDGAVEAVEPPTIRGAWIRDAQRVYADLELKEVNVVGIGVKALLRPETASYARVCERLYRRRFEV